MMRFETAILVPGVLALLVGAPSLAEAGDPVAKPTVTTKSPVSKPSIPTDPKQRGAFFEKLRHQIEANQKAVLPAEVPTKSSRIEGRLLSHTDGELLLLRTVEDPKQIAQLEKMGWRKVTNVRELGERTILGNEYVSRLLLGDGVDVDGLRKFKDKRIRVDLKRQPMGPFVVTGVLSAR